MFQLWYYNVFFTFICATNSRHCRLESLSFHKVICHRVKKNLYIQSFEIVNFIFIVLRHERIWMSFEIKLSIFSLNSSNSLNQLKTLLSIVINIVIFRDIFTFCNKFNDDNVKISFVLIQLSTILYNYKLFIEIVIR